MHDRIHVPERRQVLGLAPRAPPESGDEHHFDGGGSELPGLVELPDDLEAFVRDRQHPPPGTRRIARLGHPGQERKEGLLAGSGEADDSGAHERRW